MFRSIRVRLALWFTLVVALTFVFIAWAIYMYISRSLADSLDQSITNEVGWIAARLERHIARSEAFELVREDIFEHAAFFPTKEYIEIWDSTHRIVYHSPNLESADTLASYAGSSEQNAWSISTIKTFRTHDIRLAVKRVPTHSIFLAMPTESITSPVSQLLQIFLWLAPLVIGIGAVVGIVLAKRSFSKINQVVETARRITADRLQERIPEHNAKDEIGRIVSTFNSMISRLDVSFAQMRQFTADASHELRTPLSVIRTQLETALNSKVSPTEMKMIIADCLDESLHMSSVIDNLMLLAKADAGQAIIRRDPVDLKRLLQDTYEESVILASPKSIAVTLDRSANATVLGDEQRLRQMLLNLIDNAIKYNRARGKIHLALTREDGCARIVVSDNGIGISREEQSKIFDRFYRVDRARSREMGGSGLGLSIAKWIVEAHGGTITVNSTENKGSEFTVTLPLLARK